MALKAVEPVLGILNLAAGIVLRGLLDQVDNGSVQIQAMLVESARPLGLMTGKYDDGNHAITLVRRLIVLAKDFQELIEFLDDQFQPLP